jgi:hypothetical protein
MGPDGDSEVAAVTLTERGAEKQGRRLRPALLGDAPRSASAMALAGRDLDRGADDPGRDRNPVLSRPASAMHALERARAAWAKTQPQLQLFQPDVGGRTRGGDIPPSAPLATAPGGRPAPGPRP